MVTEVDRELLVALLLRGANSPRNLSEIIDRHDQSCQQRLSELADQGLVINKGGGVYGLTAEGANTARAIERDYATSEKIG